MTLEVLLSCMYQTDLSIVHCSEIVSDTLIINQCDENKTMESCLGDYHIRMISTTERGLSRSRNMALTYARGDICLLCDDDERFLPSYEELILQAFRELPDAGVIAFGISNQPCRLPERIHRLSRFDLLKLKSWQIAFRRNDILSHSLYFDVLMGAGSGNGAQEENKFLFDCYKAGVKIYYVPTPIASVSQVQSTWFSGFSETFFYQRGIATRYFMGLPLSALYAAYYLMAKHPQYKKEISLSAAAKALIRGLWSNEIAHQKKEADQSDPGVTAP